jgi:hypothetical protein
MARFAAFLPLCLTAFLPLAAQDAGMLKSTLVFLALALLVDAAAFGGYYRTQIIVETMELSHQFFSLDWMGFLD